MEFDKYHKVKPETLTQRQAEEFDKWLLKELWRHYECIHDAHLDIMCKGTEIDEVLESAITRHTENIEGIHQTRIRLRELFEL